MNLKNNLFLERDCESEYAKNAVLNFINELNFNFKIDMWGSRLKTAHVELYHRQNLVDVGSGKGFDEDAVIGALFESLEHNFSNSQNHYSESILVESYNNLIKQKKIVHVPISTMGLSFEDFPELHEVTTAWVKFKNILSDEEFFMPLYSQDPHCSEEFLRQNDKIYEKLLGIGVTLLREGNGISIGMSEHETILHSLNEQIERFSKSLFYKNQLMGDYTSATLIINLPPFISENIQDEKFKSKLKLIKLENPFEIPTFVSIYQHDDLIYPLVGSGSSLDTNTAILRAVSECFQLYNLSTKNDLFNIYKNDDERINSLSHRLLDFRRARMFLNIQNKVDNLNNLKKPEIISIRKQIELTGR